MRGVIADSVLFAPEPLGLVAIDSKFPLENYQNMVDKNISKLERELYEKKFKADVKPGEHSVSFSLELDDKDIEFGTTYYYCSYYFDGTDYCFGKEDSFNIKSQVK